MPNFKADQGFTTGNQPRFTITYGNGIYGDQNYHYFRPQADDRNQRLRLVGTKCLLKGIVYTVRSYDTENDIYYLISDYTGDEMLFAGQLLDTLNHGRVTIEEKFPEPDYDTLEICTI